MSKSNNQSKNTNRNPMTKSAAQRIQSASDKKGNNQSFKQRAQRAAAKNTQSQKPKGQQ